MIFRTKVERRRVRAAMMWAVYISFLGNMVAGIWSTKSVWVALFWFNAVSAGLFVVILGGFALWQYLDTWIEQGADK